LPIQKDGTFQHPKRNKFLDNAVHVRRSLREVGEGHRTGEEDMNGMRLFPKINSYRSVSPNSPPKENRFSADFINEMNCNLINARKARSFS
jgi:hypothetical protein